MTEYVRQITEQGLMNLGHIMNKISMMNCDDVEKTQHTLALIALDIEKIMTDEIITLQNDN